jgi:hypothetical protein
MTTAVKALVSLAAVCVIAWCVFDIATKLHRKQQRAAAKICDASHPCGSIVLGRGSSKHAPLLGH